MKQQISDQSVWNFDMIGSAENVLFVFWKSNMKTELRKEWYLVSASYHVTTTAYFQSQIMK